MANFEEAVKALQNALAAESRKFYKSYNPKTCQKSGCNVKNCPNKANARNLCNAHYLRDKAGKSLDTPLRCRKRISEPCSSCGCGTNMKGGWYLCTRCFKNKRRDVIKSALVKLFGGVCAKCLIAFPVCVFDFHHVHAKTKGVAALFETASLARIAKEAVKCILLCANCHRLETYGVV